MGMPDYPDDVISAERPLNGTREDSEALKAALEVDPEEQEPTGWNVGYLDGKVYIFTNSDSVWERIPQAFKDLLGILIAKNGLDHLDFRGACYGPVVINDSETYFRIMAAGSVQ